MIQIIRPIPAHLDAEHVQRLAAMKPEVVRAHLHGYMLDRRDSTQREDRDRLDAYIEAAQFVLSECEPVETRIARTRAEIERLDHYVRQHRALVSDLEEQLAAHAEAMGALCLLRAEVAE